MKMTAKNVRDLAQSVVNGGKQLNRLTPEQWQSIARLLAVAYLKEVRNHKVDAVYQTEIATALTAKINELTKE